MPGVLDDGEGRVGMVAEGWRGRRGEAEGERKGWRRGRGREGGGLP